jgi:hypothetical protein
MLLDSGYLLLDSGWRRMGAREEKVTQKGADPRKETRITKPRRPMKNFVERCFQPVTEYLFTRDQSYSIVTLQAKGERVHLVYS